MNNNYYKLVRCFFIMIHDFNEAFVNISGEKIAENIQK